MGRRGWGNGEGEALMMTACSLYAFFDGSAGLRYEVRYHTLRLVLVL